MRRMKRMGRRRGGGSGLNMPPPCRRPPGTMSFSVLLPTPRDLLPGLAVTPAFFSANVSPFQAGEEELHPVCPSSSSAAPCSWVTAGLGFSPRLTANGAAGRPPDPRKACLCVCARSLMAACLHFVYVCVCVCVGGGSNEFKFQLKERFFLFFFRGVTSSGSGLDGSEVRVRCV